MQAWHVVAGSILAVVVILLSWLLSFFTQDWYLISVIDFVIILAIIVYADRKKYKREAILLLRRTQKGRDFLVKLGTRFPRFWKAVGNIGVVLGFAFSVWMFITLALITIDNLTAKEAIPSVAILLPSPTSETIILPGVFAPPFWFWIITIALLALVHEGFHGLMAARERIKIKSLGFGLLAVIPLAFVEPDEKQLQKKKFMQQQRIFAAGSFANFILAAVSIALLAGISNAAFLETGVGFQGYPGKAIDIANITALNGMPLEGPISEYLKTLDTDKTIEIRANSKSYISRPSLLLAQLEKRNSSLIVFEDYPASRAGLSGSIVKLGEFELKTSGDLRKALEKIGPGKNISIETINKTERKSYVLETVEEPDPEFSPSSASYFLGYLEHALPANDILNGIMALPSLAGIETRNWKTVEIEIKQWEFFRENFPGLEKKAGQKISILREEQRLYPRAGFIGVSGVFTDSVIRAEIAILKGPIDFVLGLLAFMFLINFFVGAFNLLPIKALDGGRMWEVVAMKITKRHYKKVVKALTLIGLFLILVNFALLVRVF